MLHACRVKRPGSTENQNFLFESKFPAFKSFYSERVSLSEAIEKPAPETYKKYFKEVPVGGEMMVVSSIGDNSFEKLLNQNAEFVINNELHKISDGRLVKRSLSGANQVFTNVAKVKHEIQRLESPSIKNARSIQGGGQYECSGTKRVEGNLVNFNIGIYQRVSIQITNERRNTSFWRWLDGWVKQPVASMSYNAVFDLNISGFVTTEPYDGSCNDCHTIDRQIDISFGTAGIDVTGRRGTFIINPYGCGSRQYDF